MAREAPALDALVELPAGRYTLGEPGAERAVELRRVMLGRSPVADAHLRQFMEAAGRPLAAKLDALREVYDPCCADRGISIVDMGVVEDVRVAGSHVAVDLVLTTGWCPFVASMPLEELEPYRAGRSAA